MYNYRLKISYDGSNYSGWQIQANSNSIQGEIKKVLELLLKEEVNLIGSGRTDAGVHALGQIANFHSTKKIDKWKFLHSLNSILKKDISVDDLTEVNENFNSRFDAVSRSYIYLITNKKSPFYYNHAWMNNWVCNFQIDKLNELSKTLIGENDFTSFCRKKSEVENKICNLIEFGWRRSGDFIIVYTQANRFLHGMVRSLIGTVLLAAKDNYNHELIKNIIINKNRETAGESVPAKGLFLYKVRY